MQRLQTHIRYGLRRAIFSQEKARRVRSTLGFPCGEAVTKGD